MSITDILASFAHDDQVRIVISLVAGDFILGVLAAFKLGTFRLTYIANFARNDLLGKLGPWLAIFALDKATAAGSIVGPVDWSTANWAMFALITAAMAGSILSSLTDLGISLPVQVGGHAP